ncbi:MAG: septum formation family protein [Actinomycetota bacterium]|nr:septum formation family protein [Actinomycetota bacterium]
MDENQGDNPLSSEELLKRAREGLGEDTTTPESPADFKIESYPPPTAEPEPTFETTEPEPVEETPAFDATPPPPPASTDPSSWAPPPVEPDSDSGLTVTGPAPTPVRKSGSGSVFSKLWIVVVLIVAGFALFSFFDTSKTVDEIAIGDCLNTPEDDVFYEIDPIDCTEEHDLEVFALVDLSAISTEFSSVAVYPGEEAVYDAAWSACYDQFQGYIGMPYEQSVLFIDAFTPTFEGWDEVDDRIANCVVFEVDDSQSEIIKSTASLRNAGR